MFSVDGKLPEVQHDYVDVPSQGHATTPRHDSYLVALCGLRPRMDRREPRCWIATSRIRLTVPADGRARRSLSRVVRFRLSPTIEPSNSTLQCQRKGDASSRPLSSVTNFPQTHNPSGSPPLRGSVSISADLCHEACASGENEFVAALAHTPWGQKLVAGLGVSQNLRDCHCHATPSQYHGTLGHTGLLPTRLPRRGGMAAVALKLASTTDSVAFPTQRRATQPSGIRTPRTGSRATPRFQAP